MNFVRDVAGIFGFEYGGTIDRPEKINQRVMPIGTEQPMHCRSALEDSGQPFELNGGTELFYGPKVKLRTRLTGSGSVPIHAILPCRALIEPMLELMVEEHHRLCCTVSLSVSIGVYRGSD